MMATASSAKKAKKTKVKWFDLKLGKRGFTGVMKLSDGRKVRMPHDLVASIVDGATSLVNEAEALQAQGRVKH